jgi:hypothetical protein
MRPNVFFFVCETMRVVGQYVPECRNLIWWSFCTWSLQLKFQGGPFPYFKKKLEKMWKSWSEKICDRWLLFPNYFGLVLTLRHWRCFPQQKCRTEQFPNKNNLSFVMCNLNWMERVKRRLNSFIRGGTIKHTQIQKHTSK